MMRHSEIEGHQPIASDIIWLMQQMSIGHDHSH